MTWNVGECKPEGPQFFRWLVEKAQSAAVVVITLQEIEMGGSSIVMGGVKDSLFKASQVCSHGCIKSIVRCQAS